MILIMKILLHNEYKIVNLWYPTYVYHFLNFPYNYKNRVLACFQTRALLFSKNEGTASAIPRKIKEMYITIKKLKTIKNLKTNKF